MSVRGAVFGNAKRATVSVVAIAGLVLSAIHQTNATPLSLFFWVTAIAVLVLNEFSTTRVVNPLTRYWRWLGADLTNANQVAKGAILGVALGWLAAVVGLLSPIR